MPHMPDSTIPPDGLVPDSSILGFWLARRTSETDMVAKKYLHEIRGSHPTTDQVHQVASGGHASLLLRSFFGRQLEIPCRHSIKLPTGHLGHKPPFLVIHFAMRQYRANRMYIVYTWMFYMRTVTKKNSMQMQFNFPILRIWKLNSIRRWNDRWGVFFQANSCQLSINLPRKKARFARARTKGGPISDSSLLEAATVQPNIMDGSLVRLWMQCGGYFFGALNRIAP